MVRLFGVFEPCLIQKCMYYHIVINMRDGLLKKPETQRLKPILTTRKCGIVEIRHHIKGDGKTSCLFGDDMRPFKKNGAQSLIRDRVLGPLSLTATYAKKRIGDTLWLGAISGKYKANYTI
ncbi:MAG: hypothetical protein AAFR29_00515 [Pseudomonadota bacterium]